MKHHRRVAIEPRWPSARCRRHSPSERRLGAGRRAQHLRLELDEPAPQGNTLTGIVFTGNTGFAYGAGGTILRTDDGGYVVDGLATGTGR